MKRKIELVCWILFTVMFRYWLLYQFYEQTSGRRYTYIYLIYDWCCNSIFTLSGNYVYPWTEKQLSV